MTSEQVAKRRGGVSRRDLLSNAAATVSVASIVPRYVLGGTTKKTLELPPKTLTRRGGIYGEWFEAVTGGEKPSEDWIDCAVPLTELVLLGCIAVRTGEYLKWDGANMRFTNSDDANALVKPDYHNGWKLI